MWLCCNQQEKIKTPNFENLLYATTPCFIDAINQWRKGGLWGELTVKKQHGLYYFMSLDLTSCKSFENPENICRNCQSRCVFFFLSIELLSCAFN